MEEAREEGSVKAESALFVVEERGLQVDLLADAEERKVHGGVLGAVGVAGEVGDEVGISWFVAQLGGECLAREDAGEVAEDARYFGVELDVVAAENEHVYHHTELKWEKEEKRLERRV